MYAKHSNLVDGDASGDNWYKMLRETRRRIILPPCADGVVTPLVQNTNSWSLGH